MSKICKLFLSVPLSAVRPVRILCWIPIIAAAVCPIALAAEPLARVKAIAAGAEHTIALTEDGKVLAWGANWAGQLGDGATVPQSTPVPVKSQDGQGRLEGIIAIAAGTEHSVALRDDGTVWAWGGNRYGQLGDGTTDERNRPVQVRGKAGEGHLEGITAIASGVGHTVALKDDGTVWVLGRSDLHEWDESNCFPRQVKIKAGEYLTGITAIAAGEEHTVALREDGTVWAWGINWEGTLGDGTQTRTHDAVQAQIAGCCAIALVVSPRSFRRSYSSVSPFRLLSSFQLPLRTAPWPQSSFQKSASCNGPSARPRSVGSTSAPSWDQWGGSLTPAAAQAVGRMSRHVIGSLQAVPAGMRRGHRTRKGTRIPPS